VALIERKPADRLDVRNDDGDAHDIYFILSGSQDQLTSVTTAGGVRHWNLFLRQVIIRFSDIHAFRVDIEIDSVGYL